MYSLYYSKHVAKHRIINEWSISEEDPRSTGYFQWIVIYDEYVGIKRASVAPSDLPSRWNFGEDDSVWSSADGQCSSISCRIN